MAKTVWYVSKYVITPGIGEPAGRAFGLMREVARSGHESVIITSDSQGKYGAPLAQSRYDIHDLEGVRVCWVRTLKYRDSNSMRRVLSWFDFEFKLLGVPKTIPAPNTIVVSSLSLLTIFNGLRWRRKYNCRLVFEVRDIWPLTMTAEGGYSQRNPFVKILAGVERLAYRRADAILGTMPNLGEHVHKVTGQEIETFCVPMGIDVDAYQRGRSSETDCFDTALPADRFIVGYAGSVGISNALDVLFQCAQRLESKPKIHFAILGDGELRDTYLELYGNLRNVTFLPRVPKSLVNSFLERCDLLYLSVHKSEVWEYGLSLNKLIDYMYAGRPILASYSGHQSMINEAECGSFAPAGDVEALRVEIMKYSEMSKADLDSIGVKGKDWLLSKRDYHSLADDFLRVLFLE